MLAVHILRRKLWAHWTESRQISTGCRETIADYSTIIEIAVFQSTSQRRCAEWKWIVKLLPDRCKNCTLYPRKLSSVCYILSALQPIMKKT